MQTEIRDVIGTRHGEKLYETLLNREEMVQAEDMGNYYQVPADVRDLNYACYFNQRAGGRDRRPKTTTRTTPAARCRGDGELLLRLDIITRQR